MKERKVVGRVTHFFPKISVAVVEVEDTIRIGDRVMFEKGDRAFEQVIESMQIDKKPVEKVHRGQMVGIKVEEPVREGFVVYKVG